MVFRYGVLTTQGPSIPSSRSRSVRLPRNREVVPGGCCRKVYSTTDSRDSSTFSSVSPSGGGNTCKSGPAPLVSFFGTFTLSLKRGIVTIFLIWLSNHGVCEKRAALDRNARPLPTK